MPKKATPKEYRIGCPNCDANLIVKVTTETITPAEPAIKKENVEVSKDTQTTLSDIKTKKTPGRPKKK